MARLSNKKGGYGPHLLLSPKNFSTSFAQYCAFAGHVALARHLLAETNENPCPAVLPADFFRRIEETKICPPGCIPHVEVRMRIVVVISSFDSRSIPFRGQGYAPDPRYVCCVHGGGIAGTQPFSRASGAINGLPVFMMFCYANWAIFSALERLFTLANLMIAWGGISSILRYSIAASFAFQF